MHAQVSTTLKPITKITPGTVWKDTNGEVIEAHGGGIMQQGNIYYWYGENHAKGEGNKTGISCYSSKDLLNWHNEGVVLPKEALPVAFRDSGACERPKVIYNDRTKKYVMWMHLVARGHLEADAGIAVADQPAGPFKYLYKTRPIRYNYGYRGGSARTYVGDPEEETKGNTFRDMTLFKDSDNKAYVIYASEDNATMYISLLNADYEAIATPAVLNKTWVRALPGAFREAPAVFKADGWYYMFTSGTTGWKPNPAKVYRAKTMLGKWEDMGNPCAGDEQQTSFRSQPTCVIPAPGRSAGNFIYMGDRWVGEALAQSTYVWLPFSVPADGNIRLQFYKEWSF
ncbi:glycoside hydrolase family 43 protein [Deminuibacter soli]|uniref:glycoside hydrolase family 43 protein n=1 Tax=Deminuibacter soli TaxID=2291815 RepID=UPI001314A8C0|nr:glycoside hydrolase family 43 protein [Deminuibacter soli]